MPSTERRLRRIDEKRPDTGGGAIVPPGGGAPAGAPSVGVPGTPQSVRIVNTFLLHGQGQGLAGANVAWAAPTGTSPDSYLVQWDVASGFTAPTTRTAPRGQLSIALDAMPTGATVYVRVAAVLGGVQGAWSATASDTTPSDTATPAAPTDLAAAWSGVTGDLALSWTASTSQNVRDYRVRIYASSGGALLREAYTPAAFYTWTRGMHFADTGGAYDPSVYVVVTARSWGGVLSDDLTGTATLSAPATPTSLASSWASDDGTAAADVLITWATAAGVAGYRLTIDSTARDVGFTGRYDYSYRQNQAEHAGTADPALSLSLVALDALGQTSTAATLTATNAAPPAAAISTYAGYNSTIALVLTASTARDFSHFEVEVSKDGAVQSGSGFTTRELLYTHEPADGAGSYTYRARAVDLFAQAGAWSSATAAVALNPLTIASLREDAVYSDILDTSPAALKAVLADDIL